MPQKKTAKPSAKKLTVKKSVKDLPAKGSSVVGGAGKFKF